MNKLFLNLSIVIFSFFLLSSKSPLAVAPEITLNDINGKKVHLSDFKGKVVYLDIWASWCGPCLYEMKNSGPLKEHFKDNQDLVFVYISIDSDLKSWKAMVKKRAIHGVHLISKEGLEDNVQGKFNMATIPRYILIDKKGNIADFNAKAPSDGELLISDIEKVLAQ
jgi:thiol-disulfide isomerase/thioredoxin